MAADVAPRRSTSLASATTSKSLLAVEQDPQAAAYDLVVVGEDDADRSLGGGLGSPLIWNALVHLVARYSAVAVECQCPGRPRRRSRGSCRDRRRGPAGVAGLDRRAVGGAARDDEQRSPGVTGQVVGGAPDHHPAGRAIVARTDDQ